MRNTPVTLNFIILFLLTMTMCRIQAQDATLDLEKVPTKGVSLIWSPLFQASWDKINTLQKGKIERVVPPNPEISKLENFDWDKKKVMPKGGYAVYAGPATQAFAENTAASIHREFDVRLEPNRIPEVENGLAAYGILIRELKFKRSFFRSEKRPLKFHSGTGEMNEVSFFGTAGKHSANYSGVVQVLTHQPKTGSFILSISAEREEEKLIVYRPEKPVSFQEAFKNVQAAKTEPFEGQKGSATDGSLHRLDVVMIPYVNLDVQTSFKSTLSGSIYYSEDELPWRVVKAFQLTKFELHESGAKVRVDTGIGMEPFGAPPTPPPVVPRKFICDAPFFVLMWKSGSDIPYFALWVDGFETLTPFSVGHSPARQ